MRGAVPAPPLVAGPCLQPGKVGSAEVKGAELETEIRIGDGLSIDASVRYLQFGVAGVPGTSGTVSGAIGLPRMWAFSLKRGF